MASWASWDEGTGGTATQSKSAPMQRRRFDFGLGGGGFGREEPEPIVWRNDPNTVTHNPQAPPTGQDDFRNTWSNRPGVQFNDQGQAWDSAVGGYRTVNLPAYAGDDPQSFYNLLQEVPEEYRGAFIYQMQRDYADRQSELEALGRGRTALTGQMGDVDAAADRWRTDPNRALVLEEMARRASPDYQFITPQQRTAYEDPIRQGYALADVYQRGNQAGRGVSQGGDAIQSNQALAIQAATGGNQLRAQIDADEQRLKQQALSSLAGTTAAYNASDAQYVNASNQLAGALAALESGVDYESTDYTIWPALNDATQRADEEADFRDRALTDMEEQAKFSREDLAELILSSIGSGLPGKALSLAGGLF